MDAKRLERARAMEKAGQLVPALQAYRELGAVDDAARLLGANKRQGEAAELLLGSLKCTPAQVGQLDAAGKKRALMAAIFFSKAGQNERAVQLFMALGEQQRAVELLQRAGDSVGAARLSSMKPGQFEVASLVGDASRPKASAVGGHAISLAGAQKLEHAGKLDLALESYVQLKRFAEAAWCAERLERFDDAAQLYADAGQPYEAASCYARAGDSGKQLDNLIRVPKADPRYREAAGAAVRLATGIRSGLTFQLEHFLGAFAKTAPAGDDEREAFWLLGKLYRTHDFADNAREAFEKVRGYKDADAQLRELAEGALPSEALARQVLGNSDLHRRGQAMPSLGALPDLPGLDGPLDRASGSGPGSGSGHGSGSASGSGDEAGTLLHYAPGVVARVTGKSFPPADRAAPVDRGAPLDRAASRRTEAEEPLDELTPEDLPENLSPDDALPEAELEPEPPAPAGIARFEPGHTIADRYLIQRKIGQGGMATVFRARDLELEEDVALKVFGVLQSSEVLVARFKQELKLSRQLQHPNIIRLYDIGLHDGHRYISMELLTGKSLKEAMEQPIDFVRALDYLVQACAGLQAAHDAGVIHRDVKPDNFFITEAQILKVMDFGIAKQSAAPGVTVMGSIAGTPLYMSPEQIGNFSTVTAATDLYALGICAYELFTGVVPFSHAELVPLLMMQVNEKPARPTERNPSIPADLEAAILRLLEKDPAQRFATARETGAVLAAIRDRYV